ncbi:hypothetical protein EVAR_12000_1 [Eumeta japonica]|uniref:Uncharacterized protein n=1 Tax=Eumeta variegata TaxID=151549 RepID=A0A4C1U522_EUMVA|nr:hypothetical protein EVAR_12000_1 [Eumeta japonica]
MKNSYLAQSFYSELLVPHVSASSIQGSMLTTDKLINEFLIYVKFLHHTHRASQSTLYFRPRTMRTREPGYACARGCGGRGRARRARSTAARQHQH